jgi:hypothetical protein
LFVFVFAWLAQHHKPWVVLTAGTALLVAGIGIFAAGFSTHPPLISRAPPWYLLDKQKPDTAALKVSTHLAYRARKQVPRAVILVSRVR